MKKTKSKMILGAQKEIDIDLKNSILVGGGGKNSYIVAGLNAGIRANYLIST